MNLRKNSSKDSERSSWIIKDKILEEAEKKTQTGNKAGSPEGVLNGTSGGISKRAPETPREITEKILEET